MRNQEFAVTRKPEPVSAPARPGLLARKLAGFGAGTGIPFRIVFANGETISGGGANPAFTMRFHTRRAERRLMLFGYVGLLESYFDGSLDVDGDLALAFRAGMNSGYDLSANPLV